MKGYKRAVDHVRRDPSCVGQAWRHSRTHPAGCLFRFCTPDGGPWIFGDGRYAGDPIMVAGGKYIAWTPILVWEIQAGELENLALYDDLAGKRTRQRSLPKVAEDLEDGHLVWLAHFQRRMDETIRDIEWRRENRVILEASWPDDLWDEEEKEWW